MKKKQQAKYLSLFALFADGGTGLGLLLMPALTLQLIQIINIPEELIFIRYIGVFVLCSGLSYILPFLEKKQNETVLTVFKITALIRICVATFITLSLVLKQLEFAWGTVALYDAILAGFQIRIILKWSET